MGGKFLEALTSSGVSNLLQDCDKQSNLVQLSVIPKINARPSKPKKVKASPPPKPKASPSPSPSPPPKRTNVDRVGSRAQMEADDEVLFEAVEEEPNEGDSATEDSSFVSSDDVQEGEESEEEDANDGGEEVEL